MMKGISFRHPAGLLGDLIGRVRGRGSSVAAAGEPEHFEQHVDGTAYGSGERRSMWTQHSSNPARTAGSQKLPVALITPARQNWHTVVWSNEVPGEKLIRSGDQSINNDQTGHPRFIGSIGNVLNGRKGARQAERKSAP